jgi:hypothetical protein
MAGLPAHQVSHLVLRHGTAQATAGQIPDQRDRRRGDRRGRERRSRVLESIQVVRLTWRRRRLACRLQFCARSTGMDRLHSLTHPFDSYFSRTAGVAIGLTLLWYGSAQISVAGLMAMFLGLIAVVSAAVPHRHG